MAGDLCLAIDLGTGGLKVGLIGPGGAVVAQESHQLSTDFGDNGSATQDAHRWWELISGAAQRLTDSHGRDRVGAVGVTGQWCSTVPVDAEGVPVGPCITWQDTRGGTYVRERIGGRVAGYKAMDVARWVRRTGGAPSKSGGDPVGHILLLTHAEPDIATAARWFLEPVDYLTMRFTGVAAATHASMQGSWLTDVRNLTTLAYDDTLIEAVDLPARQLPPLVPIGSIVATVRGDVADALGLRHDAIVVTGVPDLQAAALGAGATSIHSPHVALSTTSWISCPVATKKTDISHSIATVPGLSNDHYLVVNNQDTGAKALEWLRSVLADVATPRSFPDLTALAATSPPGSRGVIFTPWLAGERSPVDDRSARGGFTNISLRTSTADLVRAVLEGVAMNSAWLLGYVDKFCGVTLQPIRILGGGAQSELWCQIFADAYGRTVEQVPDPLFAQMRGVAALSEIARGDATLESVEKGRPPGRTFTPAEPSTSVLRDLGPEIPDIYTTSKARFRRLNRRH